MKKPFKNCSECVAFHTCFSQEEISNWNNENNYALSCDKPHKGRGNDMVKIKNTSKRLSLKKAFRMGKEGRIIWEGFHEVRFLDDDKNK
ncbi:MAG: hypothetical protein ACOYI2_08575 [Bacillota bacterium]|jgi:hypothetical protein